MNHEIDPETQGTVKCKICRADIPAAARKCTICNEWQNWQLKFGIEDLSHLLALLIALVGIVATSAATIVGAFTPKDSALRFVFASASADAITVLVTNTGTRPGVILDSSLIGIRQGSKMSVTITPSPLTEGGHGSAAVLVPPEQTLLVHFSRTMEAVKQEDATGTSDSCSFVFRDLEFRFGTEKAVPIPVSCQIVARFAQFGRVLGNNSP